MAPAQSFLADDFRETPYWWEVWQPHDSGTRDVSRETHTAIVGAGYAGLCCALELARHGETVTVLEAGLLGAGASTLSGGQVTGGVNVGKSMTGRAALDPARVEARLTEAAAGYRFLESLIKREDIDCDYRRSGRLAPAWTRAHLEKWQARIERLNALTDSDVQVLSREALREELATDAYVGGVLINGAGQLHPAKYYAGLLSAAQAAGVRLCSQTPVTDITREGAHYRLTTPQGRLNAARVIIATNGYTGALSPALRRGIVPVTSHQIATQILPEALQHALIPGKRSVADTGRVTTYYRYSPDGKRFLFGGRARFYPLNRRQSAGMLHQQMVARFPQLRDVSVSFSWGGRVAVTLDALPHIGRTASECYYALGCNGSGITTMSWLGHRLARHLIEGEPLENSAFGTPLPGHPLYHGRPWFMPVLGSYYQWRDRLDRRQEERTRRP
ncbi:NAD(P)/FAD-dependent oxidoreductase [Kushneria indalinina]|uniref:Glycine/D-amino acid oxidase-like deaminating enzyme n=1 Tax=Kushneria indalinina DSM 14324 TaxID=1122140 RepID=A0A3D9DSV6_9GAMM|nr:FAD-binding oxidoreductase [Kushneria indalinina]REC93822.1 glycine/D-amino acid oxidase-like deaminating enzyme [Kushneria indalinina DSM 14324]